MTIKQLQKVVCMTSNQRVKINDCRTCKTIETVKGWAMDPNYEYEDFNYEEVERILNLKVIAVMFTQGWLYIWAD